MLEKLSCADAVASGVTKQNQVGEQIRAGGVFTVICYDKDGQIKWQDENHNLVVNVGLQDMNNKYFTGSGYTATWYIGLYGPASTNNPLDTDTAASHPGWTEVTPYSNATRPAANFGAATSADPSVITNSLSPASFAINATETVGGAFLISNNTKGGSTGVLFSAVDFASPGDRNVVSGDTLVVTYTFSLAA